MAKEVVAPLANYPNGTFNWGPRNILDTDSRISFQVQRCTTADPTIWPNATTQLEIIVEQFSSGEWREVCGVTAGGGINPGRVGGEAPTSGCAGDFFAGTNRQIRGSIAITGGPLRSSGTIEIT